MSIIVAGTWSRPTPYRDYDEEDNAQNNLDQAIEAAESALLDAIADAGQDEDRLYLNLKERLSQAPRCPITIEDALGIALQSIDDNGSWSIDDWGDYEGYREGISDHAAYHAGRPGECGSRCPGYIVIALETG